MSNRATKDAHQPGSKGGGLVPPYPMRHYAMPDHTPPNGKHARGRGQRGPWLGTQRVLDPAGRRAANLKARRPEEMKKAIERVQRRQEAQGGPITELLARTTPKRLKDTMSDIFRKLEALQGRTPEPEMKDDEK